MKIKNAVIAGMLAACISGAAQAALQARDLDGNTATAEAYYDDDFNITWLKDANLAASNGFGLVQGGYSSYNFNGTLTWDVAQTWFAAMNAQNYMGYNDWRLPSALNRDGSGPCSPNRCTSSEMGHLYFEELGGVSGGSIASSTDSDLSLFSNLLPGIYWTSTAYTANPHDPRWVWWFAMDQSTQGFTLKSEVHYAWVVRSGDSGVSVAAPIPEPETYAMLLAGLGLLGLTARRRKQKLNA